MPISRFRHSPQANVHKRLVSAPFLTLCDYLMHRSLFFSKKTYETRVSEKNRRAFIQMSWETHSKQDARQELAECWKNYVTYRNNNPQHAEGLPVGRARKDEADAEQHIHCMQTALAPSARQASARRDCACCCRRQCSRQPSQWASCRACVCHCRRSRRT